MTTVQRVAAGAATLVLALLTALMSAWRVSGGDGHAHVRLSWRTEPIRVEECRPLSEEEQARIPAHMRRTEECTGYYVDYLLRLTVDGGETVVDTLSPSGLRRDRPVYVLRDQDLPPGRHTVEVDFSALVPDSYEPDALPVHLRWSGPMDLGPGDVGLVTLDERGRALVRRQGPDGGP